MTNPYTYPIAAPEGRRASVTVYENGRAAITSEAFDPATGEATNGSRTTKNVAIEDVEDATREIAGEHDVVHDRATVNAGVERYDEEAGREFLDRFNVPT